MNIHSMKRSIFMKKLIFVTMFLILTASLLGGVQFLDERSTDKVDGIRLSLIEDAVRISNIDNERAQARATIEFLRYSNGMDPLTLASVYQDLFPVESVSSETLIFE